MNKKRTAVLINGCHLDAKLGSRDWEQIAFGNLSYEGRVVMGIAQVLEFEASLIIFGTGASHKNSSIESEYTRNKTMHRLVDLYGKHSKLLVSPSVYSRLQKLLGDAIVDTESQNTRNEVRRAIDVCIEKEFERLVLVSSAFHIARVHTEALEYAYDLRKHGMIGTPDLIAVGAHDSTENVIISEPPHRGDRSQYPIHLLVKEIDRRGRKDEEFCRELEAFLESKDIIVGFGSSPHKVS